MLMEKPIAATPDEGREMIRLAEAAGVVLQVGHLERFNPAFLAARPLIDGPRFFEIHRLGVFVPRSLDVNVVLDLMIHDLDMVLHLTGSKIREIQAVGVPILTGKFDIANVRLRFENGAVANLTASRVSSEKTRKLRFFQPNAYISIDLGKQTANTYTLQPAETPTGQGDRPSPAADRAGRAPQERAVGLHPEHPGGRQPRLQRGGGIGRARGRAPDPERDGNGLIGRRPRAGRRSCLTERDCL